MSDENFDSFKQKLQAHADQNGLKLSNHADNIIKMSLKRNGSCPCRVDNVQCPCPTHLEEIAQYGKCHCSLFIR